MQSCCWSQCWRHKARQSQHSSCQDRWLSKRPEVGQRRQPDTRPKEQRTRVSGQRHSLVLWHRSNVLGAFFTQWESGTWVQQDLTGICVDDELERAEDLQGKWKVFVCAQIKILMNWKTVGPWTSLPRNKRFAHMAMSMPSKRNF